MSLTARIFILIIGTLAALAMLVSGLLFLWHPSLDHPQTAPAVACLAGGALVAMLLVIDPLVPQATLGMTMTLKIGSAVACCAGGALTLYPVMTV